MFRKQRCTKPTKAPHEQDLIQTENVNQNQMQLELEIAENSEFFI